MKRRILLEDIVRYDKEAMEIAYMFDPRTARFSYLNDRLTYGLLTVKDRRGNSVDVMAIDSRFSHEIIVDLLERIHGNNFANFAKNFTARLEKSREKLAREMMTTLSYERKNQIVSEQVSLDKELGFWQTQLVVAPPE